MSTKRKSSEAETFELYRGSLSNAESDFDISEKLAKMGYNSKTISEGKELLTQAREAYDTCLSKKDTKAAAYKDFKEKKAALNSNYTIHKEKAGVVFKKEKTVTDKLAIYRRGANSYVKWVEKVKKFYSELNADEVLKERLTRLELSAEDIENGLIQIKELEASRDTYMKEKGKAQNATKLKNSTLAQMSDWMDDFYKMAKLALRDQPQLLEALGKVV